MNHISTSQHDEMITIPSAVLYDHIVSESVEIMIAIVEETIECLTRNTFDPPVNYIHNNHQQYRSHDELDSHASYAGCDECVLIIPPCSYSK